MRIRAARAGHAPGGIPRGRNALASIPHGSRRARRARRERSACLPRFPTSLALLLGFGLVVLAPSPGRAQSPADTVVIRWTAPGDDGRVGTATSYELRYSESPIDAGNFGSATLVPNLPQPMISGTTQRVTVRGLTRGTPYYFAIRTVDDAGNWSGLSNVALWNWNLDTAPPAAPTALSASREGTDIRVSWSPNTEPDLAGYTVYRAFDAAGPFVALNGSLLTGTEYLDTGVPPGTENVWYRVSASDTHGNESPHSGAFLVGPPGSESASWKVEPGYPNPSHLGDPVTIPVRIPAGATGSAILDILDSGGRRVRRVDIGAVAPGTQNVVWDGRNDAGAVVVPGVYKGWLIAGGTRTSVTLLRVP